MKVLIVDDHPLIREAMSTVLQQLDANIEVLEAGNCEQALAITAEQSDLSLVLLDIRMPGKSGLDVLQLLRESHPELPAVVLSASEDPADVVRAIDLGAMGFIPKSQPSRVMLNALRLVLSGGVYLPHDILRNSASSAQPQATAAEITSPEALGLTPRQGDVLGLIIQGMPNKLICRELGLAEGTVKIHVTAILKALGVSNRTQAVIAVSRLGMKLLPLTGKTAGGQPAGKR